MSEIEKQLTENAYAIGWKAARKDVLNQLLAKAKKKASTMFYDVIDDSPEYQAIEIEDLEAIVKELVGDGN